MTDVDTSAWIRDLSEKLDKSRAEAADLRRLVEEAQAETKAANKWRDSLSDCLIKVESERDRLKGELAEARRFVVERGDKLTLAIDFIQQVADGDVGPTEARAFLADFAAPPAEQAQPTLTEAINAGGATFVTTRWNEPSLLGHCGGCTPENPSTVCNHSSHLPPVEAAEQAQGEAPAVWPTIHGLEQHYREVRGKVDELVERVDALAVDSDLGGAREAKLADWHRELKGRVATLEEWARRQVAEPWFDPERKPAPPPPEVAGPAVVTFDDALAKAKAALDMIGTGWVERQRQREAAVPEHAFVDDDRGDCVHCGDGIHASAGEAIMPHTFVPTFDRPGPALCGVPGCGRIERAHAVPPIPEVKT